MTLTEGQLVARQMKKMTEGWSERPLGDKTHTYISHSCLLRWADRLEREATGGPTDAEMDSEEKPVKYYLGKPPPDMTQPTQPTEYYEEKYGLSLEGLIKELQQIINKHSTD